MSKSSPKLPIASAVAIASPVGPVGPLPKAVSPLPKAVIKEDGWAWIDEVYEHPLSAARRGEMLAATNQYLEFAGFRLSAWSAVEHSSAAKRTKTNPAKRTKTAYAGRQSSRRRPSRPPASDPRPPLAKAVEHAKEAQLLASELKRLTSRLHDMLSLSPELDDEAEAVFFANRKIEKYFRAPMPVGILNGAEPGMATRPRDLLARELPMLIQLASACDTAVEEIEASAGGRQSEPLGQWLVCVRSILDSCGLPVGIDKNYDMIPKGADHWTASKIVLFIKRLQEFIPAKYRVPWDNGDGPASAIIYRLLREYETRDTKIRKARS